MLANVTNNICSTVVEHLTQKSKIKGSIPPFSTGREKMAMKIPNRVEPTKQSLLSKLFRFKGRPLAVIIRLGWKCRTSDEHPGVDLINILWRKFTYSLL
jgi:hypothetical protein